MGCVQSQARNTFTLPEFSYKTGILSVIILHGNILSSDKLYPIEPQAIIKVSNQEFQTTIPKQKNISKVIPSKFDIHINSRYKEHGRTLTIETLGQKDKSLKNIGIGVLDLDDYLVQDCQNIEAKCFINYERKSAGHVNLLISFKEYMSDLLLFKIDSLFVRLQNSYQRQISTKITIGQQVLQTCPKIDDQNQECVPSWKLQPLLFLVPAFLHQGLIEVVEKTLTGNIIIGEFKIDLVSVMKQKQMIHNQQFYKKEYGYHVTGSIIFQTNYCKRENINTIFSDKFSVYTQKIKSIQTAQSSNHSFSVKQIENKDQLKSNVQDISDYGYCKTEVSYNQNSQRLIEGDFGGSKRKRRRRMPPLLTLKNKKKSSNYQPSIIPISEQQNILNFINTTTINVNPCKNQPISINIISYEDRTDTISIFNNSHFGQNSEFKIDCYEQKNQNLERKRRYSVFTEIKNQFQNEKILSQNFLNI